MAEENNLNMLSSEHSTSKSISLQQLKEQRDIVIEKLNRFINFVKHANESELLELESRLDHVSNIFSQFEHIQSQIESLEKCTSNSEYRETFENSFFKAQASAKNKIVGFHSDIQARVNAEHNLNQNIVTNRFNTNSKLVLPPIDLPIFDGDQKKWVFFYQRFHALVDQNQQLSQVEKLYYLQGRLRGDAEKLIQQLELTDANYLVALRLLQERFENKKIIIDKHVEDLLNMPVITKESASPLRNMIDTFKQIINSLKALGEPTDSWDRLLIQLLKIKLDSRTRERWHEHSHSQNKREPPPLSEFLEFLVNRCEYLESKEKTDFQQNMLKPNYSHNHSQKVTNYNAQPNKAYLKHPSTREGQAMTFTATHTQCVYCNGEDHYIYTCKRFLKLSGLSRQNEVIGLKLCLNCLRSGHLAKHCNRGTCKVCQKRHNTLIHLDDTHHNDTNNQQTQNNSQTQNYKTSMPTSSAHLTIENTHSTDTPQQSIQLSSVTQRIDKNNTRQNVLLGTASVFIKDDSGNLIKARALLDSGSQSNLITTALARKLNIPTTKINLPVIGVNHVITNITEQLNADIISRENNSFHQNLTFLVINKLSANIPNFTLNTQQLDIPKNIVLADPDFEKSDKIDILFGAGIFWDILTDGQFKLGDGMPIMQKTLLGWVISGPISNINTKNRNEVSCNLVTSTLEKMIEQFWRVEEYQDQNKNQRTFEENHCEEHFIKTISRTETGRFQATLPVREDVPDLGKSKENAIRRFYKLENKLVKDPTMYLQYSEFMKDYEERGHMSKLPTWETEKDGKDVFYLPHHGVMKDSTTTKLRVVFDASAKTDNGLSLNDTLMVGPTVQEDLFSIVVRFRQHNVAMVADIEKMYRQVEVTEKQRNLQRIVWRSSPNLPLEHFTLNTVTYGTAPASFIAIRCLHQLAIEFNESHPIASQAIKRDFYVDDLITGSNTIEDAQILRQDINKILDSGCFPLRKWKSNKPEIFTDISNISDLPDHYISTETQTRTLGLVWNSQTDTFHFNTNTINGKTDNWTKREILSEIARLFDPLGLIGPVIVKAKVIMQKLWQLKLGWDQNVPIPLVTEFNKLQGELSMLATIHIPRQITTPDYNQIEIHTFSDASTKAYGACLYLRTADSTGNYIVRLICAKSRVAPLKIITLPRLELNAALLAVNLTVKVTEALTCKINNIFYYTDSTIVLSWLNTEPALLKTFVANRVAIQRMSKIENWQHVKSEHNPADIISRGLLPSQLSECCMWWNGPTFLRKGDSLSISKPLLSIKELPEVKGIALTQNVVLTENEILSKYSSLDKLIKTVAWILRFKLNTLNGKHNKNLNKKLLISELNLAKQNIIRVIQSRDFAEEIKCLIKNKPININSKLISLSPFLDKDNLLRVGGRLTNSSFSYDKKFPYVLPHDNPVTRLLIEREHTTLLHAGPQATLASLRNNFWPLRGKQVVKKVLRQCVICFRAKPQSYNEKMGNLPNTRLAQARPFSSSGVDYAGPFLVKEVKYRNKRIIKAYLCIFICMTTKAVHLEVATDLTSHSFLNVLKRFVSRRGLCNNIYSDNGGCFVGANKDLQLFLKTLEHDKSFSNFCVSNEICWHFNPANSPHMGGLWESAVKSAKYHLKRVIGKNCLSLEDFTTLCIQVEASLNSRPLVPLTNDPNDLSPLTPSHFLIGDVLQSIPQADVQEIPHNRLSSYQSLQKMYQHYWRRWSSEYISTLQQRVKWKVDCQRQLKIGSLALLKERNSPPLYWSLARIVELHPGKDNIVRVVSLRAKNGVSRRAVSEICVLPIDA